MSTWSRPADWYNSNVPTPFYHLYAAEAILKSSDLPVEMLRLLTRYRPAFLFGHTAPDVQVVSGQPRESTHFYKMPIQTNSLQPWVQILTSHTELAGAELTNPEQIAFLFGYLCHLQADWLWVEQLFEPYFGPDAHWKSFRERIHLHNVLRSYLDFQVLEVLNGRTRADLASVDPQEWLPFVEIDHFVAWRNFLADQLKPGAVVQTVDVFAARQGLSVESFYRILNNEDEMQRQVFDFFPRQHLELYWQTMLEANIALMNAYWLSTRGVDDAIQ